MADGLVRLQRVVEDDLCAVFGLHHHVGLREAQLVADLLARRHRRSAGLCINAERHDDGAGAVRRGTPCHQIAPGVLAQTGDQVTVLGEPRIDPPPNGIVLAVQVRPPNAVTTRGKDGTDANRVGTIEPHPVNVTQIGE